MCLVLVWYDNQAITDTDRVRAKSLGQVGQQIYERLRSQLEPRYGDKIVAIEVGSGDYFVGNTLHEAIQRCTGGATACPVGQTGHLPAHGAGLGVKSMNVYRWVSAWGYELLPVAALFGVVKSSGVVGVDEDHVLVPKTCGERSRTNLTSWNNTGPNW